MSTIIPIIIFILILGLVIFVHELGHFFFARRAGIFVEEFALGMGPKIFSFKGKKESLTINPETEEPDVTLYSLRAFPIGGFCKMRGQDEDVTEDPEAINNKPVRSRILVIAGGSLMNFLMAFLLFFTLLMLRGFPVSEVFQINNQMPGYQAGLREGDRITHINNTRVNLYEELMFMIDVSGGQEMEVRVDRGGEILYMPISPMETPAGYRIGFNPGRRMGLVLPRVEEGFDVPFTTAGIGESLVTAAETLAFHIRAPFRLLTRLATGQGMPAGGGIVGPIGIGAVVAEVYQDVSGHGVLPTVLTMLMMAAILNAALGIMNLLPIPALDGARLIFLTIEGVRIKPVPPDKEAVVHMVGIVALLVLAVFIAYRDIVGLM